MVDQPGTNDLTPDPEEFTSAMADITQRSQKLIAEFIAKQMSNREVPTVDPLNVSSAFSHLYSCI